MAGILGDNQRVAVLQTGRADGSLVTSHTDYDEMSKALLGLKPSEADTYRILDEEYPENIEQYDVILITGSRHGVYEDHKWIAPLEEIIRAAYQSDKKLIGICFGHQIIAQALGGRVAKSDKGFGIGVMGYETRWGDQDSRTVNLCAWHQDQIIEPPSDAEVFATSAFCEFAGLIYGNKAISFQPHPEFTREYVSDLIDVRAGHTISTDLAEAGRASMNKDIDVPIIQDILSDFVNR